MAKSTIEQIRQRFDHDVERFSNLETGQSATMDAPLVLELISEAAARTNPTATHVLDLGCGAGNYTLKLLQKLPNLDVTLVDLSKPMLDRAVERIAPQTEGTVLPLQGDVRELDLGTEQFDLILAAMVLHHLRDDHEWCSVFAKLFTSLKPGGSLWIADQVAHSTPGIQAMMQARWGQYLSAFKGDAYRDQVLAYVEQEDTPRPLVYQLDLLRGLGFRDAEVLHLNTLFAAFGVIK